MIPEIWGKSGWDFIHFVTLDYPLNPTQTDKINYYKYFQALQHVLPCEKCRYNMTSHLKKYPLTDEVLSSRDNLVKWGIDLHNIVNHYTGKKMLTYQEALAQINKSANPNKQYGISNCQYYLILFVVLLIVCGLIYFIFKRVKQSK